MGNVDNLMVDIGSYNAVVERAAKAEQELDRVKRDCNYLIRKVDILKDLLQRPTT